MALSLRGGPLWRYHCMGPFMALPLAWGPFMALSLHGGPLWRYH